MEKEFNWFLRLILFKNVIGITLWPFGIYFRGKVKDKTRRHERIHWEQQKEMLGVFFYLWYFVEWMIKLFFYADAYKNISFEREAYGNEDNVSYKHPFYGWVKYLLKKKP